MKKLSKRLVALLLAAVMVMGLSITTLKTNAEDKKPGYLSNINIILGRTNRTNLITNFENDKYEYSITVPSSTQLLGIGAILSDYAPQNSVKKVYYLAKYTNETQKEEDQDLYATKEEPNLVSQCNYLFLENDQSCKLRIEAGVESDKEIYSIFVHKQDTPAANLTTQLNALPEVSSLTVSDKEAVTAAKEAYEALTDEQKSYMQPSLIQKLTDAEEKIAELEKEAADQEAAGKVIDEIKAVNPETATLEELKKVQADYDALTAEQKAIVDADATAVAGKKAIDAKVVELNKPADTKPVADKTVSVKKGATFTVKGYKYKVTSNLVKNPTVTVTGYKNKKLSKITVPATVTYKKVKFKVTAVSANAFKGQKKAKTAYLGSNVKSIGSKAFYGDGKIKKITVKSSVLTKVGSKAYKGIAKKAVIKVPSKKLKAYKKLMKGKGQAKTVKITK